MIFVTHCPLQIGLPLAPHSNTDCGEHFLFNGAQADSYLTYKWEDNFRFGSSLVFHYVNSLHICVGKLSIIA